MAKVCDPYDFIHNLKYEDLSPEVIHAAKRCLLDTVACAAAGRHTPCSQSIINYATSVYSAHNQPYHIMFDPSSSSISLPGALLANGTVIDSFDAHDTDCPTKGHIGVAIVPAVLAMAELYPEMSGKELLTTMVMGYEIAQRCGVSLHNTVADYHTSGSWNAVGCAAVIARAKKFNRAVTREALGIAEYNGPRSQMMRCIQDPTMVKDGSGWGAMVGASAALMAESGFTGAPAITVEGDNVKEHWADLGHDWKMLIQHFKGYPVCYWAQPAMASLRDLQSKNKIPHESVAEVQVHTFKNAVALHTAAPQTTEQAQYSLPFPIACLVVRGKCGVDEVKDGYKDPLILDMASRVKLIVRPEYEATFPEKFHTHVTVVFKDKKELKGPTTEPWGKGDGVPGPLTDEQLNVKCADYFKSQMNDGDTKKIMDAMWKIETFGKAVDAFQLAFPKK